jgi:hypothetical protein
LFTEPPLALPLILISSGSMLAPTGAYVYCGDNPRCSTYIG